jgi:hypothetical protein
MLFDRIIARLRYGAARRLAPHIFAERDRYKEHLDDIRCDLVDAGIAIPAEDDDELRPRWMVRDIITQRAEMRESLVREEYQHGHTIDQRDACHEAADRLAYAIASMEEIGEHSNLNDPWTNALEVLEAKWGRKADPKPRPKPTAEERLEALRRNMAEYHARDYGFYKEVRDVLTKSGRPMTTMEIACALRDSVGAESYTECDRKAVSDYARCGYLTVTKVKGVPHYSLPMAAR